MNKKKKTHASCSETFIGINWAVLLVSVFPITGQAAPWDYGAIVELGVIHTDNLFLAPDGLEESETAYTIAPELFMQKGDDRLEANIRYKPEVFFYPDLEDSETVFHTVDASLTANLVRDRLFLFLNGVNFQSIKSAEGIFPISNLPVSGNRVDSRVLEVRPYWRQRVGRAQLQLDTSWRDLNYDDSQFQGSRERMAEFSLNNFQQQQGVAWGTTYSYRRMEYDLSAPWDFQRAAFNLGFWLGGNVRLFGVGGVETAFDNIFESNLDENFWEAGFQYKPSDRFNLELAAGERSYGTSFRTNFSYRLRRGNITIDYNETPSSRGEGVFNRRPLVNTDNLDNFLDRPGASDRFVRKRAELQTSINLSKSDLSLRIFREERERRIEADGTPLPSESYAGVAIRWNWKFGTKTSVQIGADIANRDSSNRDDELRRAKIELVYQMTQRISVRLQGSRSDQTGNVVADGDYTENQLRLLLRTEL